MGIDFKVDADTKALEELLARLSAFDGLEIEIGFVGEDGKKKHPLATVSIATIAMYNEFGTIDAPARPFLRSTFIEHSQEIADAFAQNYARAIEGDSDPVDVTEDVAKFIAGLVRQRILTANAWATPNAPATIDRKEHDRVLLGGDPKKNVAPGTMLRAVGYTVMRNGRVLREGN